MPLVNVLKLPFVQLILNYKIVKGLNKFPLKYYLGYVLFNLITFPSVSEHFDLVAN